ncbi:MAG: hypothetical protein NC390_04175 [Fusobacterium sp.]|nr:hypothetical protein [Fusobacterium sp.]
MRKLAVLLLMLLAPCLVSPLYAEDFTFEENQLRDYDGIQLNAGTFVPVINTAEVSTLNCDEGFPVKFIATSDLYLYDTTVIPRETEFYGYLEEIKDPVVGTNASMKIRITRLVYTDGFEIPLKAYIYTPNNNIIGGELTPPAEWVKIPHYQKRFFSMRSWAPTLQVRPGNKRQMGEHIAVKTGERCFVVLMEPVMITHTLTE